jgi:hypothetical protein
MNGHKLMNYLLRAACIAAYVLALASLGGFLPEGLFSRVQLIAVVLLALHVLELVFMFKYVRLYRGSLAVSVVLTLLFGLLHWLPLARAQAAAQARE